MGFWETKGVCVVPGVRMATGLWWKIDKMGVNRRGEQGV